jgi:hypothetical protein
MKLKIKVNINCGHIKHNSHCPSEDYYLPSTTERKKAVTTITGTAKLM